MITELVLVSHAPTSATRTPSFPLDEPIEDAGSVHLELPRFDHGLCAPSRAAQETARILGLDVVVTPALRDADHGAWAGRRLDEVAIADSELFAAWVSDPGAAPPGGESVLELIARVGGWIDGRVAVPGTTVAVTHAAVIRAALVHAVDAGAPAFWHYDVGPLTAVVLRGDGRRWMLRALTPRPGNRREGPGEGRPVVRR